MPATVSELNNQNNNHAIRLASASADFCPIVTAHPNPILDGYLQLQMKLLLAYMRAATRLKDIVFVPPPASSNPIEGAIPTYPNLRYWWHDSTNSLAILGRVHGDWVTLVDASADVDGAIRDKAGNLIARSTSTGLVIDAAILAAASKAGKLRESENATDEEIAAAMALALARAMDKSRRKLCPAPGPENNKGWSPNSVWYQSHVTGLPPGWGVYLNGVWFDGCVDPDGPMQEAKGAYAQFLDQSGQKFEKWYKGADDWPRTLKRQSEAAHAAGMTVVWHAQEKPIADYIRELVEKGGYDNITVIWDPWP